MCNRYFWASKYCAGQDVLEIACGMGQGAGYLASISNSYLATDYSWPMVYQVKSHYGSRVDVVQCVSDKLPIRENSVDVILVFEAIYYFEDIELFFSECVRVLREGGRILIVSANKDLYDFNPSPFSKGYYGVVELGAMLGGKGFNCEFSGDCSVRDTSLIQKIARPVKWLTVNFNLVPRTNDTKKWLKKLIFGSLVPMPPELKAEDMNCVLPRGIVADSPDKEYKVIFCAANRISAEALG
jgi:ubiquinone/menaquinone biosynthesis C-methylase UbiE